MKIQLKDKNLLRELGHQIAAAAADPVNGERRELRKRAENKENVRPWISITQEPWAEFAAYDEMKLQCEDRFCRGIENAMRHDLFKWHHFPGDMTINAVSDQKQCIHDTGFGIKIDEECITKKSAASVASHHYNVQIKDEADIALIKEPVVAHNAALTEELYQARCEIFDGILDVQIAKKEWFWFAPWDELVCWTGAQEVLGDMALRPEYIHKLIAHHVNCWNKRLDQYEDLDLLRAPTNELEGAGAAQIFSAVSPEMHGEFALQYESRFLNRFKNVYYGCCEPLHKKVDICAEYLPSMNRISMSPWIDFAEAVKNIGNRFIFAWKPNPAMLAFDKFDSELVRKDIREKLKMARDGGCTLEIYLKDISTVCNDLGRLTKWGKIAKEEAERSIN